MASTYRFCVTVFGVICLPRWRQTTSPKTSWTLSAWSIALSTESTVVGPIAWPDSTSSTSSSATSLETSSTCCTALMLGAPQVVLGQLLLDQLADDGAVSPAGDLWHHVGHHAAEVAHARGAVLGDRVVDDLLQLVLGERLGHELLQHGELLLLRGGPLLVAARTERLRCLDPLLLLTLEHLQLLLVVQLALQLLFGGAQVGEDQPQRVAAQAVPRAHRLGQLVLDPVDEAHAGSPRTRPPSRCHCR